MIFHSKDCHALNWLSSLFKVAPYSYSTDQNMTYIDQNSITSRAREIFVASRKFYKLPGRSYFCARFSVFWFNPERKHKFLL